ncbi:MAG TPA: S53 family peptidase [Nitrospira sp.]|nr:S53 family peptidase [Nitrospira sp.]
MTKILVRGVLFLALGALLFGQPDPGDQNGHPAVPPLGRGEIRPHVWIRDFLGRDARPQRSTVLSPSQIQAAYGINLVAGGGQGATVAIVDAYDSPNAASDLATFSSHFGISCTTGGGTFNKVNQNGLSSPLPARNSGWEVEINLDTQWVHANAPCANIVLVEANSNSTADLMTAVNTAKTFGSVVSVVSMSWGGSESSGQTAYDSDFVASGVTFLASSGDTGGKVEWPSSSPYVIGVGGTNLTLNSNNTVNSETAWSGSGGGCSAVEPAISSQTGFVPSSCTHRATPDVAMDGGNQSPVYVYISLQGGWYSVYGTSLSVQLWAGVVAIANGLRGSSTPLAAALNDLYVDAAGAPSSLAYIDNYRDITSGKAGSFSAGSGWDFITGLGSPKVDSLVPSYLIKSSTNP